MKEEYVLRVTSVIEVLMPPPEAQDKTSLTFTIMGPSDSWQDEKNDPMVLDASKLLYEPATEAHISQANIPIAHVRNTGLRPMYSAAGTQTKF